MSTYQVQHLTTKESFTRPWMLLNPHVSTKKDWTRDQADPAIEAFHRTLPDYNETTLHDLKDIASELGLGGVFLKDESTRFGLPAFKILGASWAVHRAVSQRLDLDLDPSLEEVREAASEAKANGKEVRLVTCSEGNWGRASARMAAILDITATIYVPGFMSEYTRNLLRGEGADVRVLDGGSYDDSIAATRNDAEDTGALMILDTSFDGYEEVPKWVTAGYSTMLTETDRQISSLTSHAPNTFFVSVGVGSWAHSVVSHYKSLNNTNRIVSVEPIAAASLKESLHCGEITSIRTGETIMAGMCCGTTSQIAWPVLRDGVHAAVAVTEEQAHQSVEDLSARGIKAGPCGAATLAALRRYVEGLDADERRGMFVVLFSTEGWRRYEVPP